MEENMGIIGLKFERHATSRTFGLFHTVSNRQPLDLSRGGILDRLTIIPWVKNQETTGEGRRGSKEGSH
jgi:hypothetical protein